MLGIGKEAVWDLGEMEDGERRTEKLIEKQMMRIDRFRPLSSRVSVVFEMVLMEFVLNDSNRRFPLKLAIETANHWSPAIDLLTT